MCFALRAVKLGNRSSTADAIEEVFPCFLNRVSYWSDGTKSCYYYYF